MPSSNPVDSMALSSLVDDVDVAANTAVTAMINYEQQAPPKDKTDVCAALQSLKDELNDLIAAINATMADLGCGA